MNVTLEKFGYPHSVIKSYQYWSVLLRPQQVTLGALILGAHSQAEAFSDLDGVEIEELSSIIKHLELTLSRCFNYDKINYLMLMMVDPKVHFHVIPRYAIVANLAHRCLPIWAGPGRLIYHKPLHLAMINN